MADVIDRLNAALSDRFRIEREIGRGGMAAVYLAEDLSTIAMWHSTCYGPAAWRQAG